MGLIAHRVGMGRGRRGQRRLLLGAQDGLQLQARLDTAGAAGGCKGGGQGGWSGVAGAKGGRGVGKGGIECIVQCTAWSVLAAGADTYGAAARWVGVGLGGRGHVALFGALISARWALLLLRVTATCQKDRTWPGWAAPCG